MGEFIGKRVVPCHDGVWDKTKVYEPLVIVLDEESGDSYISRRDVPAGILLTDTHYWSVCTRFSMQMEKLNEDVDADVKAMHKDVSETKAAMSKELSDTKSAMSKELADTKSTMSQELTDTKSAMSKELTDTEKRVTDQGNAAALAMQETETNMNSAVEQMQKRLDANVSASTEENADYATELVDARVDSDGNTYATAGAAVRAITEGLRTKIKPFSANTALQNEGTTAVWERKEYSVSGHFTYGGSGYMGLFAGFFGKFESVQGKKIRVVIHTDIELSIQAIMTNAANAWGSLDGTVHTFWLEQVKMNAGNRFTHYVDVDFSREDIVEFAAALDANRSTLYFCLRRESGAPIQLCNVAMYAYELTDVLNLGWKYVAGYEELLLLDAEMRDARNDGTLYPKLGEAIRKHGDASDDVIAARTNSWGIQFDSLAERLKTLDTIARPKVPIGWIQALRDNHNGALASETTMHSREVINNNAVFVFDCDGYMALEKQSWSSIHFAVYYEMSQIEAIKDNGNLWLDVLLEGANSERPSHAGEMLPLYYYVNGVGNWSVVHNKRCEIETGVGIKQNILITPEQIENVLAAGNGFYIVFDGYCFNNDIVKDMGQLKITVSLSNDAGSGELLGVSRVADIAGSAVYAEVATEALHAQETDHAGVSDKAKYALCTDIADNFFLNTPENLLNLEGKRFSPGMDTTELPKEYPLKGMNPSFQCVKETVHTISKDGIYPIVHLEMTLCNTSSQISNQGYCKMLNGMLSVNDMLNRFENGYKHFYICAVEDYLPIPEKAKNGAYPQILLISYKTAEQESVTAVYAKPVMVQMLSNQRAFTMWRVELRENHLAAMLERRDAGSLSCPWFGIWHTKKYDAEEDGRWIVDWHWQDYAFTDGSYTDEEMAHFFQSKYTYWVSCVNHPYLKKRLAGLDERADSVEEAVSLVSETAEQMKETLDALTPTRSITCWGDSLTAGGGWTSTLEKLSGLKVYNGGTGGENARTIVARQGADVMVINTITIPAECIPVTIAERATDGGILTQFGNKVTPLLQGGAHVNPVTIGDVEGTLKWTGSNYADKTGIWTFTRSMAGEAVVINRPTAIRTAFDRLHNGENEIMVIYIGQNGGYKDDADLIRMHRLMIDHCKGKEYVVIGYSSGTAEKRAEYEAAMLAAFGRRFISLREYLAHPIYDTDGETVISCYGLDDAGLDATEDDIEKIKVGQVPQSLLADAVHYTAATKTVIGQMLYKKMVELGIL